MASKAVVDAVESRLAANWTATPIIGVNLKGEPPTDGSPFLTVQYPVANSRHVGMAGVGNRTFREEGVLRLVLSVRRGRGQSQALQWCDQLAALFRAQQFNSITCRVPSPPIDNNDNESGNYFVLSIAIPYFYDLVA
jgi:Bacteriophage related domain of unknown function